MTDKLIEKIAVLFDIWKEKRLNCEHIYKKGWKRGGGSSLALRYATTLIPYGCKKMPKNNCHFEGCPKYKKETK